MVKSAPKNHVQSAADETAGGARVCDTPLPVSYEAALAELDEMVTHMESGSLSLEESLAAYRRGVALVRFCQQQLEKVEQQVRRLDGETLKPVLPDTATDSSAQGEDDDLTYDL